MKKLLILLLFGFSISLQGQNFFWSHNSVGVCTRPTGLTTYAFNNLVDDYPPFSSFQNAFELFMCWVGMGPIQCAEMTGTTGQMASVTIGDTVWYGTGTACTYVPDGYYVIQDCDDDMYHQRAVRVSNDTISELYWCFNLPSPGYLYNWHAVNGDTNGDGVKEKEIAPTGWHVPTQVEFDTLANWLTLNGYGYGGSGPDIAKSMASTSMWFPSEDPGEVGNDQGSNNSSGLNMMPVGIRYDASGAPTTFDHFSTLAVSWTTTFNGSSLYSFSISFGGTTPNYYYNPKNYGQSIRLIKDNSTLVSAINDYDGNEYQCVKLGNQVWLTSNLKVQHYNDGTAIPEVTDQTTWNGLTTGARCVYNNDEQNK